MADPIGVIQMPLHRDYSRGTVSLETKAKICRRDHPNPHFCDEGGEELCPRGLPLLSEGVWIYRWRGNFYAALNCVLRSGHTPEEKTDMLRQLWTMFQKLAGIQEIPSGNAMEMGQIIQAVGHE
jgi:hypothetical protein